MLSSREGDDAIHRALAAGALAYVLKRMPTAALLEAIRAAAAGKVPLAPEVLERLGTRSTFGALSPREIEVLQRIAGGASNKEIGAALGISANTVKNHINKILEKLGAADRTQAVTVALQRGIIDLD
jgi:DNA-binding NarL/FixJ family response regulator